MLTLDSDSDSCEAEGEAEALSHKIWLTWGRGRVKK